MTLVQENWKNFCIIGNGNHATSKIIPALIAANKNIKGIVSSKNKIMSSELKQFNSIKESLNNVPENTVFIIATPPNLHFKQAKQIIKYGRDIIIEKPIFISIQEVKQIYSLVNFNKNIILEGFMHRYTKLYIDFLKYWTNEKEKIVSITSTFYVPEIPKKTFRDKKDIISSCLYDMGCYGLSLINDMGLDLRKIKIDHFQEKSSRISKICLKGMINNISIEIKFGKNKNYENYVELVKENNNKIKFFPFFYGRKASKSIQHSKNNDIKLEMIDDHNSFQVMFNQNRNELIASQKTRLKKILIVTRKLENLANELETIKAQKLIS